MTMPLKSKNRQSSGLQSLVAVLIDKRIMDYLPQFYNRPEAFLSPCNGDNDGTK